MNGPDQSPAPPRATCLDNCLDAFDTDGDDDVDLFDFADVQSLFN